jgi:hypothetical protein
LAVPQRVVVEEEQILRESGLQPLSKGIQIFAVVVDDCGPIGAVIHLEA